jgi:hypothetical protein
LQSGAIRCHTRAQPCGIGPAPLPISKLFPSYCPQVKTAPHTKMFLEGEGNLINGCARTWAWFVDLLGPPAPILGPWVHRCEGLCGFYKVWGGRSLKHENKEKNFECPTIQTRRKKNSDDGGEFGGWLKKAYQPLPASQRARQVRVGAAAPPKMVARPSALLSGINYHLQKVAAQQATQHLYKRRIFLAAWQSSPPPPPLPPHPASPPS